MMTYRMTTLRASVLAATCLFAGLSLACPESAEAFKAKEIATLADAVDIASAPQTPNLLFVVRQSGIIEVLDKEKVAATPFLNITRLVQFGGEQGLLSMTFSPNYKTNRLFYVFYVNKDGDIEVDEFRRSLTNPLKALSSSRRKLITVNHRMAGNHNGGQVKFGPDGFLYISIGDGGNPGLGNDGRPASQLTSNLGKILRIDPRPGKLRPYRIPADNPYVGKAGNDPIYAYGLRNPWRFSFSGNNIIIADVGQGNFEEVNFRDFAKTKGTNFGWPAVEGMGHPYAPQWPGPDKPTNPIFEYDHNSGGCAITGGYIVEDPKLPSLVGRYIFGDFCTGAIHTIRADSSPATPIDDKSTGLTFPNLTTFGIGAERQVYFAADGKVYRITP